MCTNELWILIGLSPKWGRVGLSPTLEIRTGVILKLGLRKGGVGWVEELAGDSMSLRVGVASGQALA